MVRSSGVVLNVSSITEARNRWFPHVRYEPKPFEKPKFRMVKYPALNGMTRDGEIREINALFDIPFESEPGNPNSLLWWQEIHKADMFGRTALHEAAEKGSFSIFTLFLTYGANPYIMDCRGQTPLHYACRRGFLSIINAILSCTDPKIIEMTDINQNTPLHISLERGHISTSLALLSANNKSFDLSAVNYNGHTIISLGKLSTHFYFDNMMKEGNKTLEARQKQSLFLTSFLLAINGYPLPKNIEIVDDVIYKLTKIRYCSLNWVQRRICRSHTFHELSLLRKLSSEQVLDILSQNDMYGRNAIHYAAEKGDKKAMEFFFSLLPLSCLKELIFRPDQSHNNSVLLAAKRNYWDIVRWLCSFIMEDERAKKDGTTKNQNESSILARCTSFSGDNLLRCAAASAPLSFFELLYLIIGDGILSSRVISFPEEEKKKKKKKKKKEGARKPIVISGLLSLSVVFHRDDILDECHIDMDVVDDREGEEQSSLGRPLTCLAFDTENWSALEKILLHNPNLSFIDRKGKGLLDRFMNKKRGRVHSQRLLPLLMKNKTFSKAVTSISAPYFLFRMNSLPKLLSYPETDFPSLHQPLPLPTFFQILWESCHANMDLNTVNMLYKRNQSYWGNENPLMFFMPSKSYFLDFKGHKYLCHTSSFRKRSQIETVTRTLTFLLAPEEDLSIPISLSSSKGIESNIDWKSAVLDSLTYFGYWDHSVLLFETIPNSLWKRNKAASRNLGKAIKSCIRGGQVDIMLRFLPFLCVDKNGAEKLLQYATHLGQSECVLVLMLHYSKLSGIEFGRYPLPATGSSTFIRNLEKQFSIPEASLLSIFLPVFRGCRFPTSFEVYATKRGCSIIVELILSLQTEGERENSILSLLPIAARNRHFSLTKTLLLLLQGNYTEPPGYHSVFHFVVSQVEEPDLLQVLIDKGMPFPDLSYLWLMMDLATPRWKSEPVECLQYIPCIIKFIKEHYGGIVDEEETFESNYLPYFFYRAPMPSHPNFLFYDRALRNILDEFGIYIQRSSRTFSFDISRGYWSRFCEIIVKQLLPMPTNPHSISIIVNQAIMENQDDIIPLLKDCNISFNGVYLYGPSLKKLATKPILLEHLLQLGFVSQMLLSVYFYQECPVSSLLLLSDYLKREYIKPDWRDTRGNSMWHIAAKAASPEQWQVLLDIAPITMDISNRNRENVLMSACLGNNIAMVEFFAKTLSETKFTSMKEAKNINHDTAFHMACNNGNMEVVELVLSIGCVSIPNKQGCNGLMQAAIQGKRAFLYTFLKRYPSLYVLHISPNLEKIIDLRCGWFHWMISTFNEKEPQVYKEMDDFLPTTTCVALSEVKAVASLMVDNTLHQYLTYFIRNGRDDAVEFVLEEKEEMCKKFLDTSSHQNCLQLAARSGHYKVVVCLLRFCIRNNLTEVIYEKNEEGFSLLHWAAKYSWKGCAERLVRDFGFSWNDKTMYNESALWFAIAFGKFITPSLVNSLTEDEEEYILSLLQNWSTLHANRLLHHKRSRFLELERHRSKYSNT